jgi:methylornithine synthase
MESRSQKRLLKMSQHKYSLPATLCKAVEGTELVKEEIKFLLSLKTAEDIAFLQRVARLIRSKSFGNKVFLYGFLYFSTYCKNDCNFCHYRCSNKDIPRYRKNESEIMECAEKLRDSGVHLIDLTMGEDSVLFHPEFGLKRLLHLVKRVKEETGLPVMISPGAVPIPVITRLAEIGTEWFACYQETHSKTLFHELRGDQSYEQRLNTKIQAKKSGMLIEEGILTGVGESLDDITNSLVQMRSMETDQVRAMSFVPQAGTPMENLPISDNKMELIIISVMRLILPDSLIPASLDIDGLNGLQDRLLAGANVITSIVPPGRGLAGVANKDLDIEDSRRTVESIHDVLSDCGMAVATSNEYKQWINERLHKRMNPLPEGGTSINFRYWSQGRKWPITRNG